MPALKVMGDWLTFMISIPFGVLPEDVSIYWLIIIEDCPHAPTPESRTIKIIAGTSRLEGCAKRVSQVNLGGKAMPRGDRE